MAGPWADRVRGRWSPRPSKNLLVAGLEPGRFTVMANGGVAYADAMFADGTHLDRVFVTASAASAWTWPPPARASCIATRAPACWRWRMGSGGRPLSGEAPGLPPHALQAQRNGPARCGRRASRQFSGIQSTFALVGDPSRAAAELHWRIAAPAGLAFVLLAVPLSARRDRRATGDAARLPRLPGRRVPDAAGTQWLADGSLPRMAGPRWLLLPLMLPSARGFTPAMGGSLFSGWSMEAATQAPRHVVRTVILTVLATWGAAGRGDGLRRRVRRDRQEQLHHQPRDRGHRPVDPVARAYNLFPTGGIHRRPAGLGQLAATSELTALRALGAVAATLTYRSRSRSPC